MRQASSGHYGIAYFYVVPPPLLSKRPRIKWFRAEAAREDAYKNMLKQKTYSGWRVTKEDVAFVRQLCKRKAPTVLK